MKEIRNIKGFKKIRKEDIKQWIDEELINKKHLSIYDLEDEEDSYHFETKVDSLYAVFRHGVPAICMFYNNTGIEDLYDMGEYGEEFYRYILIKKDGFYTFSVVCLDEIDDINNLTEIHSYIYNKNNPINFEKELSLNYIKSLLRQIDKKCIIGDKIQLKLCNRSEFREINFRTLEDLDDFKEIIDDYLRSSKYYQPN